MGLDYTLEAILEAFALALVSSAALLPFFGSLRLIPRLLISASLICAAIIFFLTLSDTTSEEFVAQTYVNVLPRYGIRLVVYLGVMVAVAAGMVFPIYHRTRRRKRKLGQWGLSDTLLTMTAVAALIGPAAFLYQETSRLQNPRIWQAEMPAWGYHGLGPFQIAFNYFLLTVAIVLAARIRSTGAMLAVAMLAPVFTTLVTYLPALLGADYDQELFSLERWDLAVTVIQPLAFTAVMNLACQINQSRRLRPKTFLQPRVRRDHSHVQQLTSQHRERAGRRRTRGARSAR